MTVVFGGTTSSTAAHSTRATSVATALRSAVGIALVLALCLVASETLHLTFRSPYFVADLGSGLPWVVAVSLLSLAGLAVPVGALVRTPLYQAFVLCALLYVAASFKIFGLDAKLFGDTRIVIAFVVFTLVLFAGVWFAARRWSLSAVFPMLVLVTYLNACLGISAGWALSGGHLIPFLTSVRTISIVAGSSFGLVVATLAQRALERRASRLASAAVMSAVLLGLVATTLTSADRLPEAAGSAQASGAQPDIYVLSFDALRYDTLEEFVASHPDSNFARLRRGSSTFSNVIAPGPATDASLTRNTYPSGASRAGCKDSAPRRMEALGYYTAFLFGRVARRFEGAVCYRYYFAGDGDALEGRFLMPALARVLFTRPVGPRDEALTAQQLLAKLARVAQHSQPIYAYLHFMEMHAPYVPARKANDARYLEALSDFMNRCYVVACDPTVPENAALVATMRAAYVELLGELDQAVANVEKIARQRNRPFKLILTADHGELFGEHGGYAHSGGFVPELMHVPFVVFDSRADKHDPRCELSLVDDALASVIGIGAPSVADNQRVSFTSPPLGRATIDKQAQTVEYELADAVHSQAGTWRNIHREPRGTIPFPIQRCQ